MTQNTIKRILSLTCALSLALAGCGGTEDDTDKDMAATSGIGKKSYTASYQSMAIGGGMPVLGLAGVSDTLFAVMPETAAMDTWNLFSLRGEGLFARGGGSDSNKAVLDIPSGRQMLQAYAGREGLLVLFCESGPEERYYACEYDAAGALFWETELTEAFGQVLRAGEEVIICAAARDGEGRLYLERDGQEKHLLILTETGGLLADIDLEENRLRCLTAVGDTVYGVCQEQGTDWLAAVNVEKKKVSQVLALPEGRGGTVLAAGPDGKLWFGDYKGLGVYAPVSGESGYVYTWTDAGITGKEVTALLVDGKERVCAVLKPESPWEELALVLLSEGANASTGGASVPTGEAQVPEERQKVVIAGDARDVSLMKAVGRFNASDGRYEAVVEEYEGDRLRTELMTGNGPDLIPLNSGWVDMWEGVERGLLEDLRPYLEGSAVLSEEMLLENVLTLYTVDGALVSIPPTFRIDSLYGRASELGESQGWTTEEFFAYVESHRGASIRDGMTIGNSKLVLVLSSVWNEPERWMDYENREARFDSEEFRQLVEFAAGYEALYDEDRGSTLTKLREGKALLTNMVVNNVKMYLYCKGMFDGDMVAIGQPTAGGKPHHGINGYGAYGISKSSQNKEGAWAFLEYLVASQTGEDSYDYGFPVLKSAFEEMLYLAATVPEEGYSIGDNEGNRIRIYPATQDELEAIRELVENAAYVPATSAPVDAILEEELDICFNGGRSVEETVKIIQSKVQIYLDEM